jgi:hypothetical protein
LDGFGNVERYFYCLIGWFFGIESLECQQYFYGEWGGPCSPIA